MKFVSPARIVVLSLVCLSAPIVSNDTRGDDDTAKKDTAKQDTAKQDAARQDAARQIKIGDITLRVPAAWKQQAPSNRLRLAQFQVPAAEGDEDPAELSVFNFGAGGTVAQQVERWKGQFLVAKREFSQEQGKIELGDYVLVEIAGTYKKPTGPPVLGRTTPMPGAKMLVAMISTEQGTYFLKLVGSKATVAAATADFRRSIGAPANMPEKADTP